MRPKKDMGEEHSGYWVSGGHQLSDQRQGGEESGLGEE